MDAGQDVEYTATFEVFPTVEVQSMEDFHRKAVAK
jgi:FKBP-type peptidyl-prolyl cis-trans isomerase (trigger factor)